MNDYLQLWGMDMHPLLSTTRRTTGLRDAAYPQDATYDFGTGVWTGPNGAICDNDDRNMVSKKNDLETGEDQKGQ